MFLLALCGRIKNRKSKRDKHHCHKPADTELSCKQIHAADLIVVGEQEYFFSNEFLIIQTACSVQVTVLV